MISNKKVQESHAQVVSAIKNYGGAGGLTAYEIMDLVLEEAPEPDGNKAFAIRQRISATCSELHASGQLHVVGTKKNDHSGEDVQVYVIRTTGHDCPCGHCPDGGKGYKAKYAEAVDRHEAERKELQEQIETLIMFNEQKEETIRALRESLERTKNADSSAF
jgi:hypothetical protein